MLLIVLFYMCNLILKYKMALRCITFLILAIGFSVIFNVAVVPQLKAQAQMGPSGFIFGQCYLCVKWKVVQVQPSEHDGLSDAERKALLPRSLATKLEFYEAGLIRYEEPIPDNPTRTHEVPFSWTLSSDQKTMFIGDPEGRVIEVPFRVQNNRLYLDWKGKGCLVLQPRDPNVNVGH
jgi:hypothetical protein